MDVNEYKNKLIEFAQEAVRTRSYSDEEGNFAALIKKTMEELKYDEVLIDSVGNVVGKIGNGSKIIHFDSHMDTVRVNDALAGSALFRRDKGRSSLGTRLGRYEIRSLRLRLCRGYGKGQGIS